VAEEFKRKMNDKGVYYKTSSKLNIPFERRTTESKLNIGVSCYLKSSYSEKTQVFRIFMINF